MEPNEKLKFGWARLLTIAGIVLVAALVVGGTTWYVMDKSAKEVKTANDKAVAELKKEIKELRATSDTKTVEASASPTSTTPAGQKAFVSSSFGLTLNYPETWTVSESSSGLSFKFNGSDTLGITIMSELPGGRGYEGVTNFTRYDGTQIANKRIVLGTKFVSKNDYLEGFAGTKAPTSGYAIVAQTTNNFNGKYFMFSLIGTNAANNDRSVSAFEQLVGSITLN